MLSLTLYLTIIYWYNHPSSVRPVINKVFFFLFHLQRSIKLCQIEKRGLTIIIPCLHVCKICWKSMFMPTVVCGFATNWSVEIEKVATLDCRYSELFYVQKDAGLVIAHQHPLAALAFNKSGSYIATASAEVNWQSLLLLLFFILLPLVLWFPRAKTSLNLGMSERSPWRQSN